MSVPYNPKDCQSLLGYGAAVHRRSGGVCQLCGEGVHEHGFHFWRQLTVEHLIGRADGGYPPQIRQSFARRFPDLDAAERLRALVAIDTANTVTACHFCQSTTSRVIAATSMSDLIATAVPGGSPDQVTAYIAAVLGAILEAKRQATAVKVAALRAAYEADVAPTLAKTRGEKTS